MLRLSERVKYCMWDSNATLKNVWVALPDVSLLFWRFFKKKKTTCISVF
jgi:hypothetical protein